MNIVTVFQILGLFLLSMYLLHRTEILEKENQILRDRIKEDAKWYKEKEKLAVDLAVINERYKWEVEKFEEQCREFNRSVGDK